MKTNSAFETLLSLGGQSITLTNTLIIIITSIALGVFISCVYIQTNKKNYSSSFAITLIMLPLIISIIILLVGNNVARAFSLAGAFSIIRFRSAPGEPKDIAYVFFTLAIGLSCGMGYIFYAILFTLVLCSIMVILNIIKFGINERKDIKLKITIPENLNFEGIFEDILNQYTNSWNLEKIKTKDFGSLFELSYVVDLKKDINQKNFIDDLRCRNGNLNITLLLNSKNNI